MKVKLEHWIGWSASIAFVRHAQADRYTVRAGRLGLSLFVDGSQDLISPAIERGLLVLFGGIIGIIASML